MQSVCTLLPDEYFQKVVELRAALSEDPALGAVYDPPFVHFTHQLATDYDWPSLEAGLAEFAKGQEPFEVRTIGLLAFTGSGTTIAVAPYRNEQLASFQAGVWQIASRCAQGRVDQFYHPERWIPHVTVKRCGPYAESFGRAMTRLAIEDFTSTMLVDNVSVQHDPGQNSLTHYQRLRFPLGSQKPPAHLVDVGMNATVVSVVDEPTPEGVPRWVVRMKLDAGPQVEQEWTAAQAVRIMAESRSSIAHFEGARCFVAREGVVGVVPNTPFPIAN